MSLSKLLSLLPFSEQLEDVAARCACLWPATLTGQALVVGVVAGLVAYLLLKKRYNLPPGPRGWPLIGNLLDVRNQDMHILLTEWQKTYGPIIAFKIGPTQFISLNRIDVVIEALLKRQADFAGRPQSYSTDIFSEGGKSIAFGNYSPTWKLHRKLAVRALRYYMTGSRLEESVERSLSKPIALIKQQKGAPLDPHDYVSLAVFNIINYICFYKTCGITDKPFKLITNVFDQMIDEFGNGLLEDVIPLLRLIKTKKCRSFLQLTDKFLTYITDEMDEHRVTRTKGHVRDFCDAMFLSQEEAEEEEDPELMSSITDIHIKQTLADIIAAGIDTSRFTLLWTLLYLAAYPDVQDKLHQEVDQVMGSRDYPVLSDRSQLQYTEAVLHEVMRVKPIVPLGLPHATMCDSKIGQYDIPKDTTVFINIHALHHDSEQWGQPEMFRPERFLDSSGKLTPTPESWLPFSAGRRVCIGESFAKPELHLLLAGIMKHFRVSLPPGVKADFSVSGGAFGTVPKRFKLMMTPKY